MKGAFGNEGALPLWRKKWKGFIGLNELGEAALANNAGNHVNPVNPG
jgi:hypothetical protein